MTFIFSNCSLVYGGVKRKRKKCSIFTTYVDGQITQNFSFMGPNHPNLQRIFVVCGVRGGVRTLINLFQNDTRLNKKIKSNKV